MWTMQSGEVWLEFVLQSGNRSLIRKAAISGLDERTYGCDVLVGTEIDHQIRKTVSPYDEVRELLVGGPQSETCDE